jgi:glyoxylase-like metal-dependent hydrolase (beta-lactamase superfamily II)
VIGVQPDAITDVILSHFHPDHTGSVSNANGLIFPNANIHFAQAEWDFIQSSPSNALTGMINMAMGQLQPAIDDERIQFYTDGDELLPDIQAVGTPGHTPGHHALLLSSGGQQLINLIDTAIHPLISLQNPAWHFVSDILPDVAAETRRSILQRAVDEQLFVFGYHFPFPGVGIVDSDGEGFRFLPVGF